MRYVFLAAIVEPESSRRHLINRTRISPLREGALKRIMARTPSAFVADLMLARRGVEGV
jgi:hypothetical protein